MNHVKTKLIEKRCVKCNALLFKADIVHGKVEQKCKCGQMNTIDIKPESQAYQNRLNLVTK